MEKKLLVTGRGLVGTALSHYADVVVGSSWDLRDPIESMNLIDDVKPTHIIHTAAKVGGLGSNMRYKGEYYYDNIMMNTNIIESARMGGVKHLVSFLSTCVFPDNPVYPLTTDQIHKGEPHNSNYAYAYAKRMVDVQIRAYRDQYGLDYKTVIPTNIYGPNDNFSLEHGHVIPMLIHKMYLAQKKEEDFVVWGTGTPLREFIFSEDVAELTVKVMDEYKGEDPVILSTSEEISIRDVVDVLIDKFDFNGNVIFDSSKPDGQFRKPSDNSLIKEISGDFKFTTFEEGMEKTINWFINNYNNIRK